MAECRACRADVIWLTNDTTGKAAPIDAAPTPGGNVSIDAAAGTYHVARKGEALPDPGHTSHFATCPQAGRFRP